MQGMHSENVFFFLNDGGGAEFGLILLFGLIATRNEQGARHEK
jgi:hypothetical protein